MDGDTQVKCVSYHPTQIDMLRADAADMGTPLEDHEQQLADWVNSYVPPEPEPDPIPEVCSPAQGLVALFALKGITEDDIHAVIASIADPVQRYTARIAFTKATEWRRGSQSVQTLAGLLSLTEGDLDELFMYAPGVNV
ncbi:MAG: hypothetical protein WBC18_12640, partial [Ottowia sp.]